MKIQADKTWVVYIHLGLALHHIRQKYSQGTSRLSHSFGVLVEDESLEKREATPNCVKAESSFRQIGGVQYLDWVGGCLTAPATFFASKVNEFRVSRPLQFASFPTIFKHSERLGKT